MGWSRRQRADSVAARALVVPFDAQNTLGNESNVSPDSRAETQLRLVVTSVESGLQAPSGQQVLNASLPNWVRLVLYFAGSNDGPSADLPDEIDVPVRVDPTSGRIVELEVDQAARELAAYRDVAVRWWKSTEAPLADVRGAIALPGEAVRGAKGLLGTWRSALARLREDGPSTSPSGSLSEAEVEQSRRTANMVKYKFEREPKLFAKARASALQAGPMMVANVRGGSMSTADFETWLQFQSTSGAISAEEAEGWRQAARS